MKRWRTDLTKENFWGVVLAYAGVKFKTYSELPFTYEIKKGRNGEYTKELWIDRREKSKSLAWSSVLLALQNIKKVGEVVDRPKALGDIRGVTYIYGMSFKVPDRLLTDGQCRMMINGIQFIQALLEANGLAAGKDHQFKGRYDAEKNAVIISLKNGE